MKFEEYINTVVQKIGPESAFNLSRDARMKALETLLIDKGIATKEEVEAEVEKQLGETALTITKLPQIPNHKDDEPTNTK